jgi:hypothetical protein
LSGVPEMTDEDLKLHLELLSTATTTDLDELLFDLLVVAYPTRFAQNS